MRTLKVVMLYVWEIVLRFLKCCLPHWRILNAGDLRGFHHECEVFKGECEHAKESEFAWKNCKKNRGHKKFIPVDDLKDSHLSWNLSQREHENLRDSIDLTVRIRVSFTSQNRPDNDVLAEYRGTNTPRVGTGFINVVFEPEVKPCPCDTCDGKIGRKYWPFRVFTASHVVYDTDEAKEAKVDLFYDDEKSENDGRMKTVRGVKVAWSLNSNDVCSMECATHDERLAQRILTLNYRVTSLDNLKFRESFEKCNNRRRQHHALVISHPHGQPKKITIGKVILQVIPLDGDYYVEHHASTCPGSSGAPVFTLSRNRLYKDSPQIAQFVVYRYVHSGTIKGFASLFAGQINNGNAVNMFTHGLKDRVMPKSDVDS